jgi:hypothetical protein
LRPKDLSRVEQEIRIEVVEFDHYNCGDAKPDGGKDWGGGEEFFHGCRSKIS